MFVIVMAIADLWIVLLNHHYGSFKVVIRFKGILMDFTRPVHKNVVGL